MKEFVIAKICNCQIEKRDNENLNTNRDLEP